MFLIVMKVTGQSAPIILIMLLLILILKASRTSNLRKKLVGAVIQNFSIAKISFFKVFCLTLVRKNCWNGDWKAVLFLYSLF